MATTTAAPQAASSGTPNDVPVIHHDNPVVAFIIGLSIILLASVLNAAGLNLTKLDHVRSIRSTCCDKYNEVITGSDKCFAEKFSKERLAAAFVAAWDVTLHVSQVSGSHRSFIEPFNFQIIPINRKHART
jgi:hypothetical protein